SEWCPPLAVTAPDTPSGHPQSETSRPSVASIHRRGVRARCRRSACYQSRSVPGENFVRCVLPPSAWPAPRRLQRPVVRVSQSSQISFLWIIDQECCANAACHDVIEGAGMASCPKNIKGGAALSRAKSADSLAVLASLTEKSSPASLPRA